MNSLMSNKIARLLAAACLIAVAFEVYGAMIARADDTQSVREAHGTDVGGDAMVVYVVRDKAAWDDMKKEVGHAHVSPTGKTSGAGLVVLDGVDFQKDMIVAVFWGRMNFAGHGENCRITGVKGDAKNGDREITVECVANLWGGDILRSYEAWPYDVKVVAKSELPVSFLQTVEYKAKPDRTQRGVKIATVKVSEWKQEIKEKPENAL